MHNYKNIYIIIKIIEKNVYINEKRKMKNKITIKHTNRKLKYRKSIEKMQILWKIIWKINEQIENNKWIKIKMKN